MLEAKPLHRVGELDIDPEIVGIKLERIAWDQPGVFRSPVTPAQWSLLELAAGAFGEADAFFGHANDQSLVGDWSGAGASQIGVDRAIGGARAFTLDSNGDGAFDPGDLNTVFGLATDRVVTGRWQPAL